MPRIMLFSWNNTNILYSAKNTKCINPAFPITPQLLFISTLTARLVTTSAPQRRANIIKRFVAGGARLQNRNKDRATFRASQYPSAGSNLFSFPSVVAQSDRPTSSADQRTRVPGIADSGKWLLRTAPASIRVLTFGIMPPYIGSFEGNGRQHLRRCNLHSGRGEIKTTAVRIKAGAPRSVEEFFANEESQMLA